MLPFVTFVAFDLETTGLYPDKDEIIEVAGVKFTLEKQNGKLISRKIGEYSSFVRPNMFIPKEATQINHITDAMVENAPPIKKVAADFLRFCGLSSVLVAHNAAFDTEFLAKAIKKNGMMVPQNPILDSIKITKKIMLEAPSHKLGELAKRLGNQIQLQVSSDKLHRALYDCEVLREVFCACLRKRFQEKDLTMDIAVKNVEKVHGAALKLASFT